MRIFELVFKSSKRPSNQSEGLLAHPGMDRWAAPLHRLRRVHGGSMVALSSSRPLQPMLPLFVVVLAPSLPCLLWTSFLDEAPHLR